MLLQHAPLLQGIPGAQVPSGRVSDCLLSKGLAGELRGEPEIAPSFLENFWRRASFWNTGVVFE